MSFAQSLTLRTGEQYLRAPEALKRVRVSVERKPNEAVQLPVVFLVIWTHAIERIKLPADIEVVVEPTFTDFANPDFFIFKGGSNCSGPSQSQTGTSDPCVNIDPNFAWTHGVQHEIVPFYRI